MTDDIQSEVANLRETVASLRERISELERRVDSGNAEDAESAAYDHYDKEAKAALGKPVADAHPREVVRAYNAAGIVDEETKKRRAKRLKRLEGEK